MKDLINKIGKKFSMEDFADHVCELKSQEAADINNSSIESQIEYLISECGTNWVRGMFCVNEDES